MTIKEALARANADDAESLEVLCRALLRGGHGPDVARVLALMEQPCRAIVTVPLEMGPAEVEHAGEAVEGWLREPYQALVVTSDCRVDVFNAFGLPVGVEVRREEGPLSVEVVEIEKPVTASITYEGAA